MAMFYLCFKAPSDMQQLHEIKISKGENKWLQRGMEKILLPSNRILAIVYFAFSDVFV